MDLVLVRHSSSRRHFLRYLMRTASPKANPFKLSHVEVYRVREFSFRHEEEEDSSKSVWNCDGEVVDLDEVKVVAHRQLVRIFGVGVEPPTGTGKGEDDRDRDKTRLDKSNTLETIVDEET